MSSCILTFPPRPFFSCLPLHSPLPTPTTRLTFFNSLLFLPPLSIHSSSSSSSSPFDSSSFLSIHHHHHHHHHHRRHRSSSLRASWQPPKYVYPDPIPEFAQAETEKFRGELRKRLLKSRDAFSGGGDIDTVINICAEEADKFRRHLLEKLFKKKKDIFGDSLEEVVRVCTEILSNFLHTEYGGPGTLLVIPFIDMADTLNERGLPGGPQAARAAVVWAQKHVDKDWNAWTSGEGSSGHNNESE